HFGAGKTDIIRQIAEETGKELIILVISQMEPGDLIGLPSRSEDKTLFLRPDWWPEKDNTIILIDEINRAHRSIRNAIMQLLLDRRIHNHILPAGTWIAAAANPPDEDYDQVDLISDPAFMSRFFHLSITPDVSSWLKWAGKENISKNIYSFIENFPEFLTVDKFVSLQLNLRPSPRSWFKLSKVLSNLSSEDFEKYALVLASGIVGTDAAKTFINFLNNETTLPDTYDILTGKTDFEIIKRLSPEDKINVVYRINSYIENLSEDTMFKILNDEDHKIFAKNIKKYSEIFPRDLIFSVLRSLDSLVSKNNGVRKAFYDKLFEEIAFELNDESWIKEL
ncbi:MAG TPA: MoxR family ATPase, partial [Tepiditoga sp.]|nr:MoxR family ATPase [Tepiditoga sp.]